MAYISSRAWSWLQLLWHRNQVKARRARALSRGWMVSSPQGMELATAAMASQSGYGPPCSRPFPRLDGVKPTGQ
ncbi:hypothetical protein CHLRE_04g217981v5 [Chlamydomonas reinhardtii]|uniref:Uncharacterized protein n=1 Tax=Chlamydomonas reinhardtii TaxID=3055 RepID=A0A2K3DTN2_CHLRE|nr:uncharacterized protein CHLRE_04g217981v5 [Chlamydomonas reinhardtii]PNW83885.1 hypothetical protein CHLRE_04g217981v5 [Chlamydomonas reinhardtii]